MKHLFAFVCLVLMWSGPSYAQHAHGGEKGPNGGPMEDVAGIDAELITSGNKITINVFDPKSAKPVATKNFTAAVLIASGSTRETVTLAPQGENSLQGDAKSPVTAGATITLTIKTAEGQSGQAKFKK
ncbi:hypothetical protein [Afipia birgiae]|jgi:hypothetical protein|uniref:hypothetical protein n=1 Tax=Afipia birgiae TaxID=151414 RepID=UPI00037291D8|nr:hypothetical protein [Afipia birgiae]MBX9821676.1 hypothetical protein [Afipia birgiae]